jgi:hypothetical protein
MLISAGYNYYQKNNWYQYMLHDYRSFHLTGIMPDLKCQYSAKAGIIDHIWPVILVVLLLLP